MQRGLSLTLVLLLLFTDLGHLLTLQMLPEVPTAAASLDPAIKVESFDQDVTTDGSTFSLTTDVGATSSAFIKINTGTRKTSAGPTGSTANTAPNIGTVGLVLTGTDEVTVERVDATAVKVMGEVWRYEGHAGGDHEFIVRDRVTLTLSNTSTSTAISGLTDVDQVVPFITGYTVDDTSVSNWEAATIAAHMDDSGNLVVSRNNSGTTVTVYVDVVEFTGSEWTVCHGFSNAHDTAQQTITLNTDSDGQGGATCDVTDWDTATIIEASMEGDTDETGLSDILALVRPGANTTTIVFDLQQDGNARNDGEAWIHVLQNDSLVVNRASNADLAEGNGTAGTAAWPAGATTTAALDTLSLEWFTDTSGVGTAHMRGGLHARITDPAGTIEHWIHRSGNTVGVEYGVIELAGLKYLNANTLVTATGTLTADVQIPSTDTELGGGFVITELTGTRNVTDITLTESGTIDGQNGIENIKLFYDYDTSLPFDCASESYSGSEDQFGSTDANGFSGANGVSSFTAAGAVTISTSQTLCGYVVYDVTDAAADSETIAISIDDPLADVVVTGGGVVSPDTPVIPTGSTVARNAELTQTHYRWLTDDAVEGSATALDAEDTPVSGFANGTIRRLRTQIDAAGSTSSVPTTFQLDYATKTAATCGELTTWVDVGDSGGAWDMSNSGFLTDGTDATDIVTGGVSNPSGQTFLTTNGGLRDTNSQTGSLTLASTNFVEFEFAIEPTATAPQGNTYCFRVSDSGSDLRAYDSYAEGTISADAEVSVLGAHTASLDAGTTGQDVGGQYVFTRTGSNQEISSITLKEVGTIDASSSLSNITLEYDLDTSAPRDCASETNDGDETTFGSITSGFSSANGTATITGSETIGTNRTMCIYVLVDIDGGTTDGETIEIQIADPLSDVIMTGFAVGPSSVVAPTGSTTVNGTVRSQEGYHWRNDDGSEAAASSATGGFENQGLTDVVKGSNLRLRLLVDNTSSITTPSTQYRLEFGTKVSTCSAIGSWNDVDAVGGAFDMFDSTNLTDGTDTTDILPAIGGITNPGGTSLVSPNGGVKDTGSETAGVIMTSSEFIELEYAVTVSTEAGDDINYCLRVTDAGTELENYTTYAELNTREKQDFFIQRGTTTISGTSATFTAGVDYTAPAATSSAFVRITDTLHTGAGNTTGGGNQAPINVTAFISDQSDITTDFTIARPTGATSNTRVSWEIIEFIGLAGTDNEIMVRDVGTELFGGSSEFATGTTVSTVADDSDVVVFMTGHRNASVDQDEFFNSLATASWSPTSTAAVFQRATSSATADAEVSYAVVEFTGANWKIQRVEHNYDVAGSTETEPITAITSENSTFVHAQKRVPPLNNLATDPDLGLDEAGHQVWVSGVSQVSFQLRSGANSPGEHYSVAWVIENTQTGTGAMNIYRSDGTIALGGTEPESNVVSIGLPVDTYVDTDNASLVVTNDSTGTGTAFPRTILGATLLSSTTYELWNSDTGQNQDYRTAVIEWPVADTSVRQNYYHFYVDNDALDPTDSWPAGAASVGENAAITGADDPLGEGERVRIRMSLLVNNASLPADVKTYKLQFARLDTTCSAIDTWTDLGDVSSGEIWRGFDGTPVDGTELATSTPATGRLNLSVSDVAGTYEEENNAAINPYAADIGEDIEYDWLIEHNGATQRSDYCFRMVESDGTELDGYNNYPTLRTTGYTPISHTWRWFNDATNTTPISPLANEEVAPTDIAAENEIKLRTVVSEVESAAGLNVQFALQVSDFSDFSSNVEFLTASSSCVASSTWCYADGVAVDGALIPTTTLSTADSCIAQVGSGCGTHNEASTTASTLTQPALSNMEFEFTLEHRTARAGGVYYFRLYDVTNDEPVVASSTYPSLVALGPQLTFTTESVTSGTVSEGVTADVDTTATSIPFGDVPFDTEYEAIYRLNVDTNATEGYQMFMYATQPLTNIYGGTIPDITGTNASPVGWSTGCSVSADACFGYHTGDDILSGGSTRFSPNDSYARISTTTPDEIMHASLPTSEAIDIVYKLQVREGQPAGDYETEIVYLAVPVF